MLALGRMSARTLLSLLTPWPRIIILVIVSLHVVMLAYSSSVKSPNFHEPSQLASGVAIWSFGRTDMVRVSPPLVRICGALPIAFRNPTFDPGVFDSPPNGRDEFVRGRTFVVDNAESCPLYFSLARLPCIVFSLIGIVSCWEFATRLYGELAGLTAVIVWCASPYVLGNGAVLMTDLPVASMGIATVSCFARWLRKTTGFTSTVTGIVLGLTILTKFTSVILVPLLPLLWIGYRLSGSAKLDWQVWLYQGKMFLLSLVVSLVVVNLGYFGQSTCIPLERFHFRTTLLTGYDIEEGIPSCADNRFAGTWLGKIPIPLPADMVRGIDIQRRDFERGFTSYVGGRWADHGWWYFYLYALLVKVPIGTWFVVCSAVGVTFFGRGFNAPWRDEMLLLVPGIVILVFISSQTGFSVHSRYLLPALPFFFVWISKVARVFEMRPLTPEHRALGAMVVVAMTSAVGSSLWTYPHSLSYFNEFVGGPRNGGEHLLDSNIDWGQDLYYLKDWLDDHSEITLDGLALHGSYPATVAGIREAPNPPSCDFTDEGACVADHLGPKPGWYAVSVNHLHGRDRQYRYFLDHFEPMASAGYSIYIYHITLDEANRVRRELGLPEIEKQEDVDERGDGIDIQCEIAGDDHE